jgi:asparagine synthase (glutamine-hydrolysing)
MCGIAGVIGWDERYRVGGDVLEKMGQAIAHRGPDGREVWVSEDRRCGLAFARLAILDLDPRAMQPMSDGRRWIVFNGEIYNFRELRGELEQVDPLRAWKTSGDTEVILRAYDAWGEKCLEKFNGMFALAIWTPESGEVFLARDRMGQKPLYFALRSGRGLALASELGALKAVPWLKFEVDLASVGEYLQTGYIAAPATIYRGISKLPPGWWMKCGGDGAVTARRYFDANQTPSANAATGAEVRAAEVKAAIFSAAKRQMVSDVPIGCFLSGGIDSSVIAAAMKAAAGEQKVLSFAMGFDDERYDERKYAAEVARHLGTEHREFLVRPEAAEDLPRLAAVFGEPFGDSSALPTHYLARHTREFVKVALSGDGGDELFGGYDRYRAMRWGIGGGRLPRMVRRMAAAMPAAHPKSALARARRFMSAATLPEPKRYAEYVGLFDEEARRELFEAKPRAERAVVAEEFSMLSEDRDAVQAALATDRVTYLPEDLLTKLDRASMLHALEVRSPFMDHELVALAAGLSTDALIKGGGKRMLREAFAAELPASVFGRRKMGFAVPIGDWLRGELRAMMEDLLGARDSFAAGHLRTEKVRELIEAHVGGKADHSQRLYGLVMLELWWRQR